jgi:hypothetical protein
VRFLSFISPSFGDFLRLRDEIRANERDYVRVTALVKVKLTVPGQDR